MTARRPLAEAMMLGTPPVWSLCAVVVLGLVVVVGLVLRERRDCADVWEYVTRPAMRSLGGVDPGPFCRAPSERPRAWVRQVAARNVLAAYLAVRPRALDHLTPAGYRRHRRAFTRLVEATLWPARGARRVPGAALDLVAAAGYTTRQPASAVSTIEPAQGVR